MLTSGAINRLNQDLNNNYLIYLDNFKFSYEISNKMTISLNDAINNELHPNVDLDFTNPLKNHVEFNFEILKIIAPFLILCKNQFGIDQLCLQLWNLYWMRQNH